MSARPFRILGVQQIAVGGLDKSLLQAFWVDLLGLTQVKSFRAEAEKPAPAATGKPAAPAKPAKGR